MLYHQPTIFRDIIKQSEPSGEDDRNRILAILAADPSSEAFRCSATKAFLTELAKGPCDLRTAMNRHGVIPPSNVNPTCLGAVVGALSRQKLIVRTGEVVPASQRQAHARPLAQWKLAEGVVL